MKRKWLIVDTETNNKVEALGSFKTLEDAQAALWRYSNDGLDIAKYIYVREDMYPRYLELNKEDQYEWIYI